MTLTIDNLFLKLLANVYNRAFALIPQLIGYLLVGFALLAHSLYQFEALSLLSLGIEVALLKHRKGHTLARGGVV